MVFVHRENQVKLQLKCVPTGCLVTGIHAHRAGSVGQHSHARRFHQPGFGHIPMCLLQHFHWIPSMPSRNTADTYPDDCHIQGIVRAILLIFTLSCKESALEVLPTAYEKTNLRPGFHKTNALRSTDHLQILKHFSVTMLQVRTKFSWLHGAGTMQKPQTASGFSQHYATCSTWLLLHTYASPAP